MTVEAIQLELFAALKTQAELARKLARLSRGQRAVTKNIRRLQSALKRTRVVSQKQCRKCEDWMDVDQFYTDKRYADGLYPYCRECKRNWYQKKKAA